MPLQTRRGSRGPYKKYLYDLSIPIPRTTVWRQKSQKVYNEQDHEIMENGNNCNNILSEEHNSNSNCESSSIEIDIKSNDDYESSRESDRNIQNLQESSNVQMSECSNNNSSPMSVLSDGENNNFNLSNLVNDRNLRSNEEEEDKQDNPLYEGCPLTANESAVLIMSFIIRWGLEDKSIDQLLQLIDCHLPCSVIETKYLFLKKFPVPNQTIIHYTCPDCFELLTMDFEQMECKHCNRNLNRNELKQNGDYFVQLSISEQIKNIMENNKLFLLMRKYCEEKDVISGRIYRNLRASGMIGENDVTLQWNTDGISPFKSSKMSMWPIQACINELPYRARRDNMILCGLYFGKKKPYINSFLKPFVEELNSLHSNGISCNLLTGQNELVNVKVHTLLASVDSVARPILQGIQQFNGTYGCSFCLHRGTTIVRNRGKARVYIGRRSESRTLSQHLNALRQLEQVNQENGNRLKHIDGVKFPTVLLTLSVFNIISSFVPDYLHSVLEGVVLTFLKHWTNSNYKKEKWYLNKHKRTLLTEKLRSILPPVEITRPSRGLDDLKLMKASELRHFLLYYSLPSLKGFLPTRYLKHWFLLVYSMSIYLREKFTQEEAIKAKRALNKFVEKISILYPNCAYLYTFNVHLLLHIPRAVENFGGLWASSTFPYEHFNGVLNRLIIGTRNMPEQVCRTFLRLRHTLDVGSRIFLYPEASHEGKKLFDSMTSKYRSNQFSQNFEIGMRLFGAPENYKLSLIEKVSIQQIIQDGPLQSLAQSFRRLIFQGTVYHASYYNALKVRNNSTVKMNDGRILFITQILVITVVESNKKVCVILGKEFDILDENLSEDRDLNISSSELALVCQRSERTVCGLPNHIAQKCVLVPYRNGVCIIPLVNNVERD